MKHKRLLVGVAVPILVIVAVFFLNSLGSDSISNQESKIPTGESELEAGGPVINSQFANDSLKPIAATSAEFDEDKQDAPPEDIQAAVQQWKEWTGFDEQRSRDVKRLQHADPQFIEALAESGDIYALKTLGDRVLLRDFETAVDYFWEAAVYGSVDTLRFLSQLHIEPTGNALIDDPSGEKRRDMFLEGLAYSVVASEVTGGYVGAGLQIVARRNPDWAEDDLPAVCQRAAAIAARLESDRNAIGYPLPFNPIYPDRSEATNAIAASGDAFIDCSK